MKESFQNNSIFKEGEFQPFHFSTINTNSVEDQSYMPNITSDKSGSKHNHTAHDVEPKSNNFQYDNT